MSLKEGLKALQQGNYYQAVELLESYCQTAVNSYSQEYAQAQMALTRAYDGKGEKEKAIALCQELEQHLDSQISNWAKSFLNALTKSEESSPAPVATDTVPPRPKAGRAAQTGVRLAPLVGVDNLPVAAISTLLLFAIVVLILYLACFYLFTRANPLDGLVIGIVISLVFNAAVFFMAPSLLDSIQKSRDKTTWIALADLKKRSPEAAEVIARVCGQKNLSFPRLGIIDNANPIAFTYGSFRDNARIVATEGLFACLDDDEIATVYAHELGHIIHWDFAVATAATSFIYLAYLAYAYIRDLSRKARQTFVRNAIALPGIIFYTIYLASTYIASYLSRTREHYADHFAAQITGNPNGLSRALVKIADGLLQARQNDPEPNRSIEGTRILNIYDPAAVIPVGIAYRLATDLQKIGQVLLWDIFNPWNWWIEMNSTHPLMGKRLRRLTTYAEQMKLDTEFDMAGAIQEGKNLNRSKLYANIVPDILLYNAQYVGAIAGFTIGLIVAAIAGIYWILPSLAFIGFGIGTFVNAFSMYPDFKHVSKIDSFTLLSDPYASPLRSRPVQLQGEIIGRADAGYQFTSDLKLVDETGTIYLRLNSDFGFVGNYLFSATGGQKLIGADGKVFGWFRRELCPRLDLYQVKTKRGFVKCSPRLWSLVIGVTTILFGFATPLVIPKVNF